MEHLWRLGLWLVASAVFLAGLPWAGGARAEQQHSSSSKQSATRVVEAPRAHAALKRVRQATRQRSARVAHSPTRNLAKPSRRQLTATTAASRHLSARHQPRRRRMASVIKPMIVIDAGHGGRDSGAVGAAGTLEKTVTLATARELARQLRAIASPSHASAMCSSPCGEGLPSHRRKQRRYSSRSMRIGPSTLVHTVPVSMSGRTNHGARQLPDWQPIQAPLAPSRERLMELHHSP